MYSSRFPRRNICIGNNTKLNALPLRLQVILLTIGGELPDRALLRTRRSHLFRKTGPSGNRNMTTGRSREPVYKAVVIGGGINGLSACYHLQRMGCSPLALVERFHIGHDRGSSHGVSRVTRSAYIEADYVRLMQIAHTQEWPRLERELGRQLIFPTSGCFFGPRKGKIEAYIRASQAADADVEELNLTKARRRFPAFRFGPDVIVLHDRTAGIIAAAEAIEGLKQLCLARGVELMEETRVLELEVDADPPRITIQRLADGTLYEKTSPRYRAMSTLRAEHLIVTAGPWARDLIPSLRPHLSVARQTVGYFELEGPPENYRPESFPVWGTFGDNDEISHYGIPEFGRPGIKAARHVTRAIDDDPDDPSDEFTNERAMRALEAFLREQLRPRIISVSGCENCLYTNTQSEDFILDHHPQQKRVVIGAGFSGHGFKLGPVSGRILAEMALQGTTSLPEFEHARGRFASP